MRIPSDKTRRSGSAAGWWFEVSSQFMKMRMEIDLCNKLASPQLMPIFLSPRDLGKVWEKTGQKLEDLPKDITVLDLRMLVSQMMTDANPWEIFHFIASPEAITLATQIEKGEVNLDDDEEEEEGVGGGAVAAAGGAGAGVDAAAAELETEDEEEEVLV